MSLGGSRLIRGPSSSCGSALTNSKAFVKRPKRSRPVHLLLVKKLPILVDLDEEVSVGVCNIEQGVHLSCVFDLIAQIRRGGSLTMLVQQLTFVVQLTSCFALVGIRAFSHMGIICVYTRLAAS